MQALARQILAVLPQTQCQRCGFDDCQAYAQAIAAGSAAINQCPPGGQAGVSRIAAVANRVALPLNPAFGAEGPRGVAVIDEAWCIGCTLCIKVCPTDAIVGSNKMMHTVIEPDCTGCALCLPVCPVDCITLENCTHQRSGWAAWSAAQANQARARYAARCQRLARLDPGRDIEHEEPPPLSGAGHPPNPAVSANGDVSANKKKLIDAVLARARAARP